MIPIDILEDYLVDQDDGLKKLLTWFLNLVMQLEAMQQVGVEPYQRAESRKAHRNGYKNRSLKTRVGEIQLKKPQFREIAFETKVFDRYSRVECHWRSKSVQLRRNKTVHLLIPELKLRGCADAGHGGVPRVARFIQPGIEHK